MDNNKSLPRKEREKLNRKMAILEAAIDLFASKGFHNTTLDEIASASEFGKGTLYNYFSSKEQIIKSIIEDVMGKNLVTLKLADTTSKTFPEFLSSYTKSIFEFHLQNPNAFILLAEFYIEQFKRGPYRLANDPFNHLHSEIDSILIKRTELAVKKKEIKKINPNYFHMLYHDLVFPYALDVFHRNENTLVNMDEHVSIIIDFIFNGISIR
jgi:TetR/AcrR family transcriptional regulator, repressor of fatR-cypB operon